MRIAHLTSVHPRNDGRILRKECRSLSSAGHDVYLLVADGEPDQCIDGVNVVNVGPKRRRSVRMLRSVEEMRRAAIALGADVFHLHDPELLRIAPRLQEHGKVVFDAHEDLPKQILSKKYLWAPSRRVIAAAASRYEERAMRAVDAVVAATPDIARKFARFHSKVVEVSNFPELPQGPSAPSESLPRRQVCYVGGITQERGARQMIEAMAHVDADVRLTLAGAFTPSALRFDLEAHPSWQKVDYVGWLERPAMQRLLESSVAGLVLFHAAPNHVAARPNKLFDYMSAGIPVICSDFDSWRPIVEQNSCGVCVDPLDVVAIAHAIDWIASHPLESKAMGENGQKAVREKFNWQIEERKLIALYEWLAN